MPRHCSATGCKSRDTKEARVAGITFHRLPKKGNPRRNAWILNSCRKGPGGKGLWEPRSDFVYFCSKHFTSDSFELAGVSGYRRLKDDAVPTVVEPRSCQGTKKRGKPRKQDVERQIRAEKEMSEGIEKVTECVESVTNGEGTANSRLTHEQQANEQAPPPFLPKDVAPELNSACDQPADVSVSPPSPSCYMRRLPPPPGFYVSKEHSYALVYPLVWRRSYEKAIDSLQKALRLLSAARRRENRLRLALTRLRESRFKQTLSQIQDHKQEARAGCVTIPGRGKVAKSDLEESEAEGTTEEMELMQEEEAWRRPGSAAKQRAGTEDEEGYCFYCGRGREDEDRTRIHDGRTRRKHKESKEISGAEAKPTRFYFCDGEDQVIDDSALLSPQPEILLQTHALSGPMQPTMSGSPLQLQQLHLLQHAPLHPDVIATQAEEGEVCGVFLVPMSSEAKESGVIGVESAIQTMDAQALLGADDELQHRDDLNVETDLINLRSCGLRGNHNSLQSSTRASVTGTDVKQSLKEHLEGFQLQLSSEFNE